VIDKEAVGNNPHPNDLSKSPAVTGFLFIKRSITHLFVKKWGWGNPTEPDLGSLPSEPDPNDAWKDMKKIMINLLILFE
jgi:hypothetical protein